MKDIKLLDHNWHSINGGCDDSNLDSLYNPRPPTGALRASDEQAGPLA